MKESEVRNSINQVIHSIKNASSQVMVKHLQPMVTHTIRKAGRQLIELADKVDHERKNNNFHY